MEDIELFLWHQRMIEIARGGRPIRTLLISTNRRRGIELQREVLETERAAQAHRAQGLPILIIDHDMDAGQRDRST